MLRAFLIACLALTATTADATIYWASSFEHCATPTSDTNYFANVSGSPAITTSNVDSLPGGGLNRCALRFSPASGAAEAVRLTTGISGGVTPLTATANLRVGTAASGAWRELLAFQDTGASGNYTRGCLVAEQYAATVLGVRYYTLGVYYGNTTSPVCTGSSQNGKRCTTSADCPFTGNPDEPQCTASTLASSPVIAEGTNILATLRQTNGSGSTAGTVTCELWQGAAGTSPSAYSRGGASRVVGYCASGGNTCNVDGDCPTTCTLSDVVTPKAVVLGSVDTNAAATTYQIDWAAIYDGTVMPNGYMEALELSSTSTADADTNWTVQGSAHSCGSSGSQYQCLKDGTSPDGNDSALENNNAAKPTIALHFGNPATPSAQPTPKAVTLAAVAQDSAAGANGITVDLEAYDGSSQSTVYTPFAFDGFTGSGSTNDPYYLAPPSLWEQSWTTTKLNALEARINKTAGGGDNGRISSLVAEVLYLLGNPAVPTTLPDRNQDGSVVLDFVGDSTWDNIDFQNAIIATLTQPSDIYMRTRGGSKAGDALNEAASIFEGATGSFLGMDVKRGTSGKRPDVVFWNHLTNVGFPSAITDPELCDNDTDSDCPVQGMARGGYCEDNGGSDQGNACYCAQLGNETSAYGATPAPNITPGKRYCITNGDFKGECESNCECGCTADADCVRGGVATPGVCRTPVPGTDTTCYAKAPTTKFCSVRGLACSADDAITGSALSSRNTICLSGCLSAAGCPNGVCVRHHAMTSIAHTLRAMQEVADARPTPNPAATPTGASGKPIVVYVIPPPGATLCWGETSRLAHGRYRDFLRQWAKANGYPFVDLYARFFRDCDGLMQRTCATNPCSAEEDGTLCFRDFVHHTYRGQVLVAAAALTECATNSIGGVSATHDGTCSGGTCTRGLTGDTCSTDADCDTWSCDFGAQP